MYLQSAEILNFHGIRHLKIDFNPETSALIGENAWGKSSLLSVLWLILGQGSDQLCKFSKHDLYIPIRLGDDLDDTAPSSTAFIAPAPSPLLAGTGSTLASAKASTTNSTTTTSSSSAASAPSFTNPEWAAKDILRTAIRHLTPEQLHNLKPYKVITTKDHHRFYFAIPSPDQTGNILRVVDVPLEAIAPNSSSNQDQVSTKTKGKSKHQSHSKSNTSKQHTTSCAPTLTDVESLSLGQVDSLSQALTSTDKEAFFKALQEAQSFEDFENKPDSAISAQQLMLRARKLLERQDINEWARCFAQADYDFFVNDIFQAEAEKIVIDLIFCESNFGAINNIERFAKLRPACYYGEDGLYRIHYRITGQEAKIFIQNQDPEQLANIEQSGTVVYATAGNATSTLAYKNHGSASDDSEEASNSTNSLDSNTLDLDRQQRPIPAEAIPDTKFVTIHELLDANGKPIDNALDIIKDLIKLNPLLRLRDRRMLKLSEMEEAIQKNAANAAKATHTNIALGENGEIAETSELDDMCHLNSLFSSIGQEDDLTCSQLNQGLAQLNVIASKYLVNYRANHYLSNQSQNKSRTAREIVSHPVSIETLNTLKQSLEDKRPSRSKFLLSLLAGAMLMNKGTQEIDPHSKPILVLEDIEGRFHPTLLLTLWSILDTIPVQKIVTTNSSALLSAMPMSNIRRLCRQYYDVRCYSIAEHALSADDERRVAFHIRISRPSAFFARCWILVEGETEVWILNEIAGILGMNLACEGVKTIEFAQCGLAPLIKLAKQLGISYYVLTDGDDAGKKYAQTVQSFTGNQHLSEHLSVIPHLDIEHYLYVSGFADVYQKAAGLKLQPKKTKQSRKDLSRLLKQAKALIASESGADSEEAQAVVASIESGLAEEGYDSAAQPMFHEEQSAGTAASTLTSNTYAATSSSQQQEIADFADLFSDTTIEADPEMITLNISEVLACLQRWGSRTSNLLRSKRLIYISPSPKTSEPFLESNNLDLEQIEYQSLKQVIKFAFELLQDAGYTPSSNNNSSQTQKMKAQVQTLTFDLSKVTSQEIGNYYGQQEQQIKRSGGPNLTTKQKQAIQRIHNEKAEVLYGLGLSNKKPKTQNLFKTKVGSNRKAVSNQGNKKIKANFTMPSALYNHLKHNFVKKNSNKVKQLQSQVKAKTSKAKTKQQKANLTRFVPSQSLTKEDWQNIQKLTSKLSSVKQKAYTRGRQLSITTTQNKAKALELLSNPQLRRTFERQQLELRAQSTAQAAHQEALNSQDLHKVATESQTLATTSAQNAEQLRASELTHTQAQDQQYQLNSPQQMVSAHSAETQAKAESEVVVETDATQDKAAEAEQPESGSIFVHFLQSLFDASESDGKKADAVKTKQRDELLEKADQENAEKAEPDKADSTFSAYEDESPDAMLITTNSETQANSELEFSDSNSAQSNELEVMSAKDIVASSASNQPALEISPKQWVHKLAQSELTNSDLLQTDLELTKAQFDPRDEAKLLRKARQQAGIKYGDYGAIEQSVLNKQGWTIDKIIDAAIHKKSKPGLAIMVIEEMQQRGKEAVPQMFRTMFIKIKRIAKSEFGM